MNVTLSHRVFGIRALMRKVMSEDRGSSFIEVIGAMVVITIVTSAFLLSFNSMSSAQNKAHSVDIAGQYARGILEEAKSTPWTRLCFEVADAGYRSTYKAENTSACAADSLGPDNERIMPTESVKVRGLDLDIRTDITFRGSNVKRVTVQATFSRGTKTSTNTYSTLLSARPDVKAPSGVKKQES